MEFYSLVLCVPFCGDASGHADQRIQALRKILHAVFGYVPPILSLFRGLSPVPAAGPEPAVQLEHRHGPGLPGAHFLLFGKPPESSQRPGAGRVAFELFLPDDAGETGPCGAVFLPVSGKALRPEGFFPGVLQRLLCPVRLGTGLSVEHHVAGHLRPAAFGHPGRNQAAPGKAVLFVYRQPVFCRVHQLLCGLFCVYFRGPGVFLL